MANQGWVLEDLSKGDLPINPRRSRCSPGAGVSTLVLSCLVANDRHETANRHAEGKPASSLRSTAGPVGCSLSGQWDKRSMELGTKAARELSTLTVFLCYLIPSASCCFEFRAGKG